MEVKALTRWVRISPDRARLVAREIQGKPVDQALLTAQFAKSKAARVIFKTLESAIANAEQNHDLDVDQLVVKEARVDQGQMLKRMKPRARGRADIIRRPTSHVMIVLEEKEAV